MQGETVEIEKQDENGERDGSQLDKLCLADGFFSLKWLSACRSGLESSFFFTLRGMREFPRGLSRCPGTIKQPGGYK